MELHAESPNTITDAPDSASGTTAAPAHPLSPARSALQAGAATAGYLVFQTILFRVPDLDFRILNAAAVISLCLTLIITVCFARMLRSNTSRLSVLLVAALITIPFVVLPLLRFHTPGQLEAARRLYMLYATCFRAVPGLRGLLMIVLATSLGAALSGLLREIKILLPVAVVLALVDLYVVFGGGLVTQANSGKSPAAAAAMRSLTVSLTPRKSSVTAPPPVVVGFADFLFVALFFACFARFGIPSGRTFALLCGTLSLYMLLVVVTHVDLPALVPIAVVVIGTNLSAFKYKREEAFAMLYAGLIVALVLGGLALWAHR